MEFNMEQSSKKIRRISLVLLLAFSIISLVMWPNFYVAVGGGYTLTIETPEETTEDAIFEICAKYDKGTQIIRLGETKKMFILNTTVNLTEKDQIDLIEDLGSGLSVKYQDILKFQPLYAYADTSLLWKDIVVSVSVLVTVLIYMAFRYGLMECVTYLCSVVLSGIYAYGLGNILRIAMSRMSLLGIPVIIFAVGLLSCFMFSGIKQEKGKFTQSQFPKLVESCMVKMFGPTVFTTIAGMAVFGAVVFTTDAYIAQFALLVVLGFLCAWYASFFFGPALLCGLKKQH